MGSNTPTDGRARVPAVADERPSLRERLIDADRLLCCLDFDGTLAPIVDDPDAAEIDPACRDALTALRDRPRIALAVVSGRALADVRERVDVDGIEYVGNHGLEWYRDGERIVDPDAAERRSLVARAVETLRDRLEPVPGCLIEDKGVTATVHYRQVHRDRVAGVRETVEQVCDATGDGIECTGGKRIVEIRPAVEGSKRTAVERLLAAHDRAFPIYVGDDVTDEAAFEAVTADGVAIHVGTDAPPTATYRIDSVEQVANFLGWVHAVESGRL